MVTTSSAGTLGVWIYGPIGLDINAKTVLIFLFRVLYAHIVYQGTRVPGIR